MARRFASPGDFELVGMSSDPTPGDPDQIQGIVQRYADIGDAAEKALNVLKKDGSISAGRGSAMDKLKEKVGEDLPDKLQKTAQSYHDAADAYRTYIPRLREAQETFDRAVDQARSAAPQAGQAVPPVAPEATAEDKAAAARTQDGIDAAKGQMSAARGLAEQAQSMRETAERTASDALDRAAGEAIPARNIFQKIADFFKDFPFVQILLGLLIAAVAVFFPVAGLLLGAGLFAVTQIAAIASGNFKLGDFLVGLITLVPGGSILKGLGAGAAVVGKALPGLAKTVKGSITGVKQSINSSKTIGPLVNSTGGKVVVGGTKGFTEGTVDEVTKQGLNGDGFDAGAIVGAGAAGAIGKARGLGGRKNDADESPPVPPKTDADAPPPIPVKTAPGGGTGSRSLNGDGAEIKPEDLSQFKGVFFPGGLKVKSAGDPPVFTHSKFPDTELEVDRTDLFDPTFKVKATGEKVFFDTDANTFRKFDGDDFDFEADLADFAKPKFQKVDDHFLVRNFEDQDLPKVDRFEDLLNAPPGGKPVLVPTSSIPDQLVRGDADRARIDSIKKAFQDGTPLPPVGLSKNDLTINDGNHRIKAAKELGLPFVPISLS